MMAATTWTGSITWGLSSLLLHILQRSLSVEPLWQHTRFPLSIGMLLARDSITGIFIPSSISLAASLFTRSVIHHLVTNSLVIWLQAYHVYYREGPEIPLRYSKWQILISIYVNSANTFGDTCRAYLWSSSYVVTFDSTQCIPPVFGSCIIS